MEKQKEKETPKEDIKSSEKKELKCGIVMPISSIDNCSSEHWGEVLTIIKDSIRQAGFEPNLVSDADDSGIIQKRIIYNLYSNDIVVCDVSAKNPNVMFELGMRLAFDKPTIIIKDDRTDYSFDTSVIEHIPYPRDLRFNKILIFQDALKRKIQATNNSAKNDPNYTTFLKHFGEFKVAQLSEKEVTSDNYIISTLEELRYEIRTMRQNQLTSVDTKKTSIPFKLKELYVGYYIKRFMAKNGLQEKDFIYLQDKEEELYEYLIKIEDISILCENENELRNIIFLYTHI